MNSKSIRYRDTWAAPGSQLYAALEAKDEALAKRIYDQCEADARKLVPPRSLLRPVSKAPTGPFTPEQLARGAEISRMLKEPKTRAADRAQEELLESYRTGKPPVSGRTRGQLQCAARACIGCELCAAKG